MRRLALFSTPASIAVADEPLAGDAAFEPARSVLSGHGLEIVPAWQARPPRRLRSVSVAVAVIAAAVATASWIAHGDDARALRERPAAAVASDAVHGQALVVSAAPARRAGSRRTGR